MNFLRRISENSEISNFIKIGPVGAELFLVDGQTDRQTDVKLIAGFCNYVTAPEKVNFTLGMSMKSHRRNRLKALLIFNLRAARGGWSRPSTGHFTL